MSVTNDTRIIAAAEAMRIKRAELQAQPLDRIWRELAYAGITAFQKKGQQEAEENVTRLSRGGAN